jgi:hypothetical protein
MPITTHGNDGNTSQGILEDFIRHIRSEQGVAIPTETLCGGITHFLSTLPGPQLRQFVIALLDAPTLWSNEKQIRDLRYAIRLSVSAKVSALDVDYKQAYFGRSRSNRALRAWLQDITTCIEGHEASSRRRHVIAGILQGKGDQRDIDWGKAGVKLEEEAVIMLAELRAEPSDLELICAVIPHIDAIRLQALDLPVCIGPTPHRRS